jgi:serine/threonine protein kinase/WD40 repeat protein
MPPENFQPQDAAVNGTTEANLPEALDYEIIHPPFGQGAYGKVWLARNAIGQWQALKAVYLANFGPNASAYEREFNGIRRYKPVSDKHPGLLRVDFVSKKKRAGYFYYVMELADGLEPGWEEQPSTYLPGDLARVRARAEGQRLSPKECARIGLELAVALDFLHGKGLTHRDVKPQNIVFVRGQPKLADVGLVAEVLPAGKEHTWVGTPGYMPPPPERPGTPQADIYGLGMVLYVLLTGRNPAYFPELATTFLDEGNPAEFMPLNAVILKACQPELAKRYASAAELAAGLREVQKTLDGMPPESPGSTVKRLTELTTERRSSVVTLLFTELVGSTALTQRLGDRTGVELIEQHHAWLRQVLAQFRGAEDIEVAGDCFQVVFAVPSEAVRCALTLQTRLREFNQGRSVPVRNRIGLHVGEVLIQETDPRHRHVRGMQVDACAHVMSLAQAGQILMTRPVFDNARQSLKGEEIEGVGSLTWLNHGRFEFKGVEEPVEICEVRAEEAGLLFAPTTTGEVRRITDEAETVLGWRPALGQLVPGTQWVLEEKLGEGGFGEVWRARHQTLKDQRVFKFCFRSDRVRSLKREVTLFRVLKERIGEHPNIVKVHDIYFDHPPFFLQEEYVAGRDLKSWCDAQGGVENVPLEARLEIVAQAADGLQAAHDAGVIHRDVKPGNILICGPGHEARESATGVQQPSASRPIAKLTDFGIGQVISEEVLKDVTQAGFTHTLLGTGSSSHTGTQFYMAPELLVGKSASTRSDIYSLGLVLYQLLVGDFKRLLTTDWANDVSDPLLREDLRHCFAGKPEDRFAAAELLAKNLRALPERRTQLERQAAEKAALERAAYRRGIVRAAAIASVIIAVIALLAWQVWSIARAKNRLLTQVRSLTVSRAVDDGMYLSRSGDWLPASLWFSEAFALDETFHAADSQRQLHRIRINSLLRQLPHLQQMWFDESDSSGGFDATGEHVLLGGANGYALYSIQSGHSTSPHIGEGCTLASLSPDGRRAVTGGGATNALLSLWDVSSGARLLSLQQPGVDEPFRGDCDDLQFSPNGRWIAAAVSEPGGRVVIWDAESGRVRQTLAYADAPNVGWTNNSIFSVRFDSSGERLVTTGQDNCAVIWEWATGRALHVLRGHQSWVYSACFAHQHTNWVITCSFDHSARVWDLRTEQPILWVQHETDGIYDVQFSPDDRLFVTGGFDSAVRLWDSETGRMLTPILRHHDRVKQVQWSRDGKRLLSVTWDGVARAWHLDPEKPLVHSTTSDFTSDGRLRLNRDAGGVQLMDLAAGRDLAITNVMFTNLSALSFAGGSNRFVYFSTTTGSASAGANQIQLWDFAKETPVGSPLVYDPLWCRFLSAPGGRRFAFFNDVATASTNGVTVWEPERTFATRRIAFSNEVVECVAFDHTGRRMVVGSRLLATAGGVLRLVDLEASEEPAVLLRSKQRFAHATFSGDDHWLAAACWNPGLDHLDALIWQVPQIGQQFGEAIPLHHRDGVLFTAFSDTGQLIATASEDKTAIVWHRTNGVWQALHTLTCGGEAYACAFSHNERWLATVHRTPETQQSHGWNGHIRLWDIGTGKPISMPFAFPEKVTRLGFLAGDAQLFVERWQYPAAPQRWLIDLPMNEGSAKEFVLRSELLSGERSFLNAGSKELSRALEGALSAEEERLRAATTVSSRLPLTKEDCRDLWQRLSSGETPSP